MSTLGSIIFSLIVALMPRLYLVVLCVFVVLLSERGLAQHGVLRIVPDMTYHDVSGLGSRIDEIQQVMIDKWGRLLIRTSDHICAHVGARIDTLLDIKDHIIRTEWDDNNERLIIVYDDRIEHRQGYHLNVHTSYPLSKKLIKPTILTSTTDLLVYLDQHGGLNALNVQTGILSKSDIVTEVSTSVSLIDDQLVIASDGIYRWDIEQGITEALNVTLPRAKKYIGVGVDVKYFIDHLNRLYRLHVPSMHVDTLPSLNHASEIMMISSYEFLCDENEKWYVLIDNMWHHLSNPICGEVILHLDHGFWTHCDGQLRYHRIHTNPALNVSMIDPSLVIHDAVALDDQLLIGTNRGLWIKDDTQLTQSASNLGQFTFDIDYFIPLNPLVTLILQDTQGWMWSGDQASPWFELPFSASSIEHIETLSDTSWMMACGTLGVWIGTLSPTTGVNWRQSTPPNASDVHSCHYLSSQNVLVGDRQIVYLYNIRKDSWHAHAISGLHQDIKDMSVWDGIAYLLLEDAIATMPLSGLSGQINIHPLSFLPLNSLQSLHAYGDHLLVSDDSISIYVPISALSKLDSETTFIKGPTGRTYRSQTLLSYHWIATSTGIYRWGVAYDQDSVGAPRLLVLQDQLSNDSPSQLINSDRIWNVKYDYVSIFDQHTPIFHWALSGPIKRSSGRQIDGLLEFVLAQSGMYKLQIHAKTPQHQTQPVLLQVKTYNIGSKSTMVWILSGCVGLILLLLALWYAHQKRRSKTHQKQLDQLQKLQNELHAQHQSLQLQLNPHFLFNALQVVQNQVTKSPKSAESTIAKMSKLMRGTLHMTRSKHVTLEEELNYLRDYLAVARMTKVFFFHIQQNELPGQLLIHPMLLQPLVENAVKHVGSNNDAPGHIDIDLRFKGRMIFCRIVNTKGHLGEPDFQGLGISTKVINERLTIFGEQGYAVQAVERHDLPNQTEVTIGIPYQENNYD